ncbi:MAG TPA: glycoside hydrolase family 16 protein [Gemmatimonadaceae bacterium]|nr:glycoside hydrolase family 16 protein [Gemmatimonadaceae bacterium]
MTSFRERFASSATTRIHGRVVLVALIVVAAIGAACSNSAPARPKWNPPPPTEQRPAKWGLSWSDEFNGTTLDASNWIANDGAANVNNELEYYTPTDVYLEGGSLVLRSQQRNLGGRQYTSGEVRSGTKRTVSVGSAVEWRTQIPSGKGIWPANWLVNTPCDGLGGCGGSWPPEIDVLEVKGSDPATNVMTHWWGSYPGQQHETSTWTSAASLAADYHTYRLEWYRDSIIWYVDGVARAKHTANITGGTLQLVMNTAVGGQFDGNPDATTVFPQYHRIDYVRVYRDTANTY